jgi:hypothetical protein
MKAKANKPIKIRWINLPWIEITQGRLRAQTKSVVATINAIFEGQIPQWHMQCAVFIGEGSQPNFSMTMTGCLSVEAKFIVESYISVWAHGNKWIKKELLDSMKGLKP